jgi:hypothetical protein
MSFQTRHWQCLLSPSLASLVSSGFPEYNAMAFQFSRFSIVIGTLAYYVRGRGFDPRTVQTFDCINTSAWIASEYFLWTVNSVSRYTLAVRY